MGQYKSTYFVNKKLAIFCGLCYSWVMPVKTSISQPKTFKKTVKNSKNEFLDEINEVLTIPQEKNGLTFVSLFAGGGGLDLGFASAGFTPVFTTDIIESFCDTIRFNLPHHAVEAWDMNDLKGDYVKKRAGKVDFIIGGPPCQSFSILGNRGATLDPRGKLIFEYVRFIQELNPKGFLFENVPGLLNVNGGKDWEMIQKFFNDTGYNIFWKKVNSAQYGVPQYRERVVLIGLKKKKEFQWPKERFAMSLNSNSFLPPPRTSALAMEYIDKAPNQIIRIHGERVAGRYSKILPGERDRIDHTDRVHPNKPSGTVLVGSGGGGGRPFIHPFEHRHLTVREAARLQSFPDWWTFQGNVTSQYRQVGNAVPVLMAHHIAKSIQEALQ